MGITHVSLCFIGADTKSRTRDLLITNQLLYQLSYAGVGAIIEIAGEGGKHDAGRAAGFT